MRYSNERLFRAQFNFLRRQFLQDGELPFTDILSRETVTQALDTIEIAWNERIYTPLATLWVFLGQVLSADHSCRAAVARFVAHRISHGESPCSSRTGAYCKARKRLPEKFFAHVARQAGAALENTVNRNWLWKNRHVYMFDGSTISMPDTPLNQEAYPQPTSQTPGVGFPLARIAGIFSLSCGAIVDMAICRYAGKGQGEVSMLRELWGMFRPGDVLLTDSLMCTWRDMYLLKERGVDSVSRLNKATRKADFRRGKRLGKDDHVVRWPKPSMRDIDRETYKSLPEYLTVREVRVRVEQPGFRSRTVIVVTTMLDSIQVTKDELADLYRMRWNNETDFSALKVTLQMDVLRCKTPELVRKEIWTHVIAYNLIRAITAQSCSRAGMLPREVSFKATVQTLEAFQPLIAAWECRSLAERMLLYEQLLDAIAVHRVGNRPGRFEPRLRKRRTKKYDYMMKPRNETKLDILKRLRKK